VRSSTAARAGDVWNPTSPLVPEASDDPDVMLCYDARDADGGISQFGPIRYATKTAKANATTAFPT
jgi:hypothetical protein